MDTSESSPEIYAEFLMLCWRRMETIRWTDRVKNEKILGRLKEKRNILHSVKKRKAI